MLCFTVRGAPCRDATPPNKTPGAHAAPKPDITMKTEHLTSLIAVGAILPLAAWGDDTTRYSIQREAYDPRPSETRSGPPTARVDETRDQITEQTSRADLNEPDSPHMSRTSTSSHTTTAASSAGIERISEEQVEQRLTASALIGTRVVDREGQEIGKVKDIGLAAVAPQLASQPSATAIAHSRSDRPGATPTSGLSQPWSQTSGESKEASVFIRPSRSLGAGDALVAIPATQLRREGDALRVDLSRDEVRSMVSEQEINSVSLRP
jgi:hypothetical protein